MPIIVKQCNKDDAKLWDKYVCNHTNSTIYHLFSWKAVIEKSYGHKTYYLASSESESGKQLTGVLPLVHLKHFVFGNSLISMPFFDTGGIIADNEDIENELLKEALKLGNELKADIIELRYMCSQEVMKESYLPNSVFCISKEHKVRMLLELPKSPEILINSFKSKLRSQIKKPIKEGLTSIVGGQELLDDFYKVFLVNMRDLGSPVHSKKLMQNVMDRFNKDSKIIIVYNEKKPYAGGIVCGFKNVLENPWASSLREYKKFSPNMLLYWTMLEYACNHGYKYFDFGRSTLGEGTYKFKKQWGAEPEPLNWHYIYLNGKPTNENELGKSKFDKAIQYWQKLPIPVTEILGPMIRKNIGL